MKQRRPGNPTCAGGPPHHDMAGAWRIIDTGPLDAFANMALDEALLRGYMFYSSPPTLRIYGWQRPSLSIGYSQNPIEELDVESCRTNGIPIVRRITGGGIILHGDELTYSLVCSKEDLSIPSQVLSSYRYIANFLINFYKKLNIDAVFACDSLNDKENPGTSSLCFAAKEKYDIVVCGRKIGGSAQKRSGGVIFQHGSIPFSVDMETAYSLLSNRFSAVPALEVTCLNDLLNSPITARNLSDMLIDAFTQSFNVKASPGKLSDHEERIFESLHKMKYESDAWNYERIDEEAVVGQ